MWILNIGQWDRYDEPRERIPAFHPILISHPAISSGWDVAKSESPVAVDIVGKFIPLLKVPPQLNVNVG